MDNEQDVEFEPELDAETRGNDPEQMVKKLKVEIEQVKKEKQENMDGWQRSKADYVNALRRFEEEKKSARQGGVADAVEALLPAFDSIERAKAHGEVPEGFAAIVKQLEAGFASLGLEPLGKVGEAFDPLIHEALGQDAVTEKEKDDTVTAVLETGWKRGDRVIRAAKVRVAHYE
jgi:molecular chaperone GrpE